MVTSLRMFVLHNSVAKNQRPLLIAKIQEYYRGKQHLCAHTGTGLDLTHLERALFGIWGASISYQRSQSALITLIKHH